MHQYKPHATVLYARTALFGVLVMCCVGSAHAQTVHTFAFVTNALSSVVQVVDIDANAIITAIPVGNIPEDVEASPNGNSIYVTNRGDNTVSVISTATNSVIATIPVGASPEGLATSPNGNTVYVANTSGNTLSVIDTGSLSVRATVGVGNFPAHIAVDPSGNPLYVTNQGDGTLSVVDTQALTVTANVPVGSYPWYVSLSPDGSIAYITNIASGTLTLLSTTYRMVLNTVQVGSSPWAVVANPDPLYPSVYVTDSDAGTVSFLRADGSLDHTTTVAANTSLYEASVTPAGNSLLVPDYNTGVLMIYKIRSTSLRPNGQISLGGTPTAVASIHESVN